MYEEKKKYKPEADLPKSYLHAAFSFILIVVNHISLIFLLFLCLLREMTILFLKGNTT